MNQCFFLRTFFHSALAILELQVYIVVEQFRAENISLLSGLLVLKACRTAECFVVGLLENLHEVLAKFFGRCFLWKNSIFGL